MSTDGRDGRSGRGPEVRLAPRDADEAPVSKKVRDEDLVFDFAGLKRPDVSDLALILTARLLPGLAERVWARALPQATWMVLGALGVDHLFHRYPSPDILN